MSVVVLRQAQHERIFTMKPFGLSLSKPELILVQSFLKPILL